MRLKSGDDLRVLLDEHNITQRQLAKSAQVHETLIHGLIHGTRSCKPETALRIVKALEDLRPPLTLDLLFVGNETAVAVTDASIGETDLGAA